jgi:hypothetical protein
VSLFREQHKTQSYSLPLTVMHHGSLSGLRLVLNHIQTLWYVNPAVGWQTIASWFFKKERTSNDYYKTAF